MNEADTGRQETKLDQAALALADHLSTSNHRASVELARLIRADEGKALEWFVGAFDRRIAQVGGDYQ